MKIINIIENNSINNQIKCEHGLCTYIEMGNQKILFDVGQSDKFINNAKTLKIDLNAIDFVVLSHGHYDHTGGIPAFLSINKKAKVILHPNGLRERFSRSSKMIKSNGIPWREEWKKFEDRILFIDKTTELFPGFWIVTDLSGQGSDQVLNDRLVYKRDDEYIPDPFEDELVIVLKEENRTALLSGCAHNGIVNILKKTHLLLDIKRYNFIGGGLHLNGKSNNQILKVIDELKDFQIDIWGLNHCTGQNAIELFEQFFPGKVKNFNGGDQILFNN